MLILLSLLAVLFSIIGCNIISTKEISMGGFDPKYEGEQILEEAYNLPELTIKSGTTNIDLKGVNDSTVKLKIGFKEYKPGDATIYLEQGELKTKSKSGKPVWLTSIIGSIPENLNLKIDNGTGSLMLANMHNVDLLNFEWGTGTIDLQNIRSTQLVIDTGTGEVNLDRCVAGTVRINTGTSSVNLRDSYLKSAEVNSGTGNLNLINSTIATNDFRSGTGKLYQEGEYQMAK